MAETAVAEIRDPTAEHPFPGIPDVGDGGDAVIWVERNISQSTCSYPNHLVLHPRGEIQRRRSERIRRSCRHQGLHHLPA